MEICPAVSSRKTTQLTFLICHWNLQWIIRKRFNGPIRQLQPLLHIKMRDELRLCTFHRNCHSGSGTHLKQKGMSTPHSLNVSSLDRQRHCLWIVVWLPITRYHIPHGLNLNAHCHENLKKHHVTYTCKLYTKDFSTYFMENLETYSYFVISVNLIMFVNSINLDCAF
jgi:hypothetical protein